MTTKNTLGKAAVVVLLATLVSACSSNAAKEEAAAQAATERAAAEQAAAAEAVAAEQRAIEKEKAMVMQEQRETKSEVTAILNSNISAIKTGGNTTNLYGGGNEEFLSLSRDQMISKEETEK